MKAVLILLYYVIISVTAKHSPQHERCETLQSVADTDNAGNLVQCTVGQSCFSMSCIPSLLPNSDIHIFIEPCKHPAAILINTTISGRKYSHEFTHSETIDVPYDSGFETPKLVVVLDNSDNTTLVFSIKLIAPGIGNYSLVPETSFPLDDITCVDGHVMTSSPLSPQHTTPAHTTYTCVQTCVAIHKMIAKTNSLCQSTQNCLTINCKSPIATILNITSSYMIEPCKSPPTILTKLDDHTNNFHYSKNVTKDTNIPLPIPFSPEIRIILEDPDNYTILFGVDLFAVSQTYHILPQQRIPIDKTGCPGYTGPTVNPYCTTQQTTVSTPITTPHNTPITSVHTHNTMHPTIHPTHNNQTSALNPDNGKLIGVIVGVILLVVVVAGISVLVTLAVVYFIMKRKSKGMYSYSYKAMDEEDV